MKTEGIIEGIEPVELKLYWPAREPVEHVTVDAPERAAELLAPFLTGADVERCAVLYLDARHQPIGTEVLGVGTVDRLIVDAWLIFRAALIEGATAIVVGRSRASASELLPSDEDQHLTQALVEAGRLVRIEVLDYLVFASSRWRSLASSLLVPSRWEPDPDATGVTPAST